MITQALCKEIPKIVLHDHLDGGLTIDRIEQIYHKEGWTLPWTSRGDLWIQAKAHSLSLPDYLETFQITLRCMQKKEYIRDIVLDTIRDLSQDNVAYAELRFCPELCTREGLSSMEVLDTATAALREAKKLYSMDANFIVCAMRQNSPSHSMEMVQLAHAFMHDGVIGVDLAGPEQGFPAVAHKAAFDWAAAHGIPITIHAGEVEGVESVRQAIQETHAKRIGHGIRILDDVLASGQLSELLWEVLERNITLEVCPTSNVQTGAVRSMKEHPFNILLRLNMPVTINTDNRLLGGVSTSDELYKCAIQFEWTPEQLISLQHNAVDAIFDESKKKPLRQLLTQWSLSHESVPVFSR